MKRTSILAALLAALALGLTACNKDGSVDTSKVESSFSSAESTVKAEVDKAVSAVKNADYAGAAASLKKLASNAKLTPDQQQSVKDLLASIEDKAKEALSKAGDQASEALKKAQDGAGKAMQDVGGALKK